MEPARASGCGPRRVHDERTLSGDEIHSAWRKSDRTGHPAKHPRPERAGEDQAVRLRDRRCRRTAAPRRGEMGRIREAFRSEEKKIIAGGLARERGRLIAALVRRNERGDTKSAQANGFQETMASRRAGFFWSTPVL